MRALVLVTHAVALAVLAGCGGPPDDVARSARESRKAAQPRPSSPPPLAGDGQREASTRDVRPSAQRPVPRDLPPAGLNRIPPARDATVPDRSTATMGASAAPAVAAAASAARPAAPAIVQPHLDDAQITARVRSLLAADQEVGSLHLDADTQDGVVTLSGLVPTAAARARASEVAKSVKDVKLVNDQLTLATG